MTNKNNDTKTCLRAPRLLLSSREVMFLGTCFSRQEAYRTTQEVMLVCLHGKMTVHGSEGPPVSTRSCLLPPGVWLDDTLVDSQRAVMGIYFLPPFSQDYPALASIMTALDNGIHCHHPDEDTLISAMKTARNRPGISAREARALIRDALIPPHLRGLTFREFDPRVIAVAKQIRSCFNGSAPSLTELAESVSLSESRLEKLFKEQTGLPITQYRVRYRVFISTVIMALGYSMTEASLLAGFSNSAHLSRCYRQVNGVTPSTTFLSRPYVDSLFDDSATDLVAGLLEGQPET